MPLLDALVREYFQHRERLARIQGETEETPYKEALAHVRCVFAIEEENARRHAQTSNLLATAATAILAAGLFRLGLDVFSPLAGGEPQCMAAGARVALIVGTALLTACTYWLFAIPSRRGGGRLVKWLQQKRDLHSASVLLFPKDDDLAALKDPLPGTTEHVRYVSYLRTLEAAGNLLERNMARDAEIFLGRVLFVSGLVAIAAAFALMVAMGWYNGALRKEAQKGAQHAAKPGISQRIGPTAAGPAPGLGPSAPQNQQHQRGSGSGSGGQPPNHGSSAAPTGPRSGTVVLPH